ncbi:hypothetical protein [Agromyces tropicus]
MTKDQQWRAVIEGLAAGLVAVGATGTSSSKVRIESAFSSAWRNWPWTSEFPGVDPASAYICVARSERRNGAMAAFALGRTAEPYLTADYEWWAVEDVLGHLARRDPGVPVEGWSSLAASFAAAMKRRTT